MTSLSSEKVMATRRIGIDFGNTIAELENSVPAPFAFEMIKHLISKYAAENVFIVSKAGPEIQKKIRQWLDNSCFYEATGFMRPNVIFVRHYVDKAEIVRALGISVFFDDSCKVVKALAPLEVVERIFWMHADPREIKQIPRRLRSKVAITQEWSSTMKYFQIPEVKR
mmetsp:Transcript_36168/g.79162  ORF Transcript_36168/g.79162 Transcript_36168/m.79162 type:complete len:168 (-) Transcript_36168:33-536(-)